ncbi:CTP synthase [Nematocida homosporus]|uniref:CTP synthase n=1 Tax=Nematocida homosporus TaxID=1912981 RepID=UPI00221EDB4E|nr:CTP synthase [Nematocida homosporus]KAI5185646.1 CTP synthase [Nematocida homosporus]
MKYILVCGGVISGVGKGVVASSIGRVLKEEGHRVTIIKIDPYLNFDAGTLGPRDHGEVFVLSDGTETDLDLGNYERFLGVNLTRQNSITSGRMYQEVITRERRGDYLGKTVQVVPHVTDHIKMNIKKASLISVDGGVALPNVCIIELGGVVGDIESITFVESLRQMLIEAGRKDFVVVGVDYALELNQEHKTKPIQASAKRARELGIPYDVMVCRSANKISEEALGKIRLFTGVESIVELPNGNILDVPADLRRSGFVEYIKERLVLPEVTPGEDKGVYFRDIIALRKRRVRVALVGKYAYHDDAYLSIRESLNFAGAVPEVDMDVEIESFDTITFADRANLPILQGFDAIIIPGGFGRRGVEEMITVAGYAREMGIPLLGICLGMQIITIEYARNVLGLANATSEELVLEEDVHTIIDDKINLEEMPEDEGTYVLAVSKNPGPMRIGEQKTLTIPGSKLDSIYGSPAGGVIFERFRHRYGINGALSQALEKGGLMIGIKNARYIDGVELPSHPFYVGVQFHPEFLSKPREPRPVFIALLKAALNRQSVRRQSE